MRRPTARSAELRFAQSLLSCAYPWQEAITQVLEKVYMYIYTYTRRQTNRDTDRQTETQTNRLADMYPQTGSLFIIVLLAVSVGIVLMFVLFYA